MRILLISNLYPPYILGGAEIIARDFAVELEALGHEVSVLTSFYGLPNPGEDGRIYRTLRYTPAAHFDNHRSPMRQLGLLTDYYRYFHYSPNTKELHRMIAEIKPDVLYVWEITGLGLNTMLAELGKIKQPIVFHLESYWLHYARKPETEQTRVRTRWFKKLLIGSVPSLPYTSLIAASKSVQEEYIKLGCDPQRIEVIYNGINSRFLNEPGIAADLNGQDAQLTFVGRLCPEKGVLVILRALDRLINEQKRQNLHFNIFGDGDPAYIKELQAFIQTAHLEDVVTFQGRVMQEELIDYYDRSVIMLVPSLWKEPFGLVLAEAMARGLPVITTNIGGPAEIVTDGVDGLLTEPGDDRALASAIVRLLDDVDERTRLSQAARLTVQERFQVDRNTKRVEQHLLRSVAGLQPAIDQSMQHALG
jgi:glycogen synthase